jgi:pyridoxamine 5'-phosphate oxidase
MTGQMTGQMMDRYPDPFAHFLRWFAEATAAGIAQPEAMALATATADGRPSVRFVLYRGMSGGGLRFFTNLESRKGQELAVNARAAVAFHWESQKRQVRFEGVVERLDDAEADVYFAERPRGNQLAAWASPQSRPIGSYEELKERFVALETSHAGQVVPRPPYWGGFRLVPSEAELWQGTSNRLHERLQYLRAGDGWSTRHLGP